MLPGYNHNIRYREKVFHVQTEDNGLAAPDLVTQVFWGGQIVAIARSNYGSVLELGLEEKVRDQRIKALMQEQHKRLLKNLISGVYDPKIDRFKPDSTTAPTESGADAPTVGESSPLDAIQFEEPVMLDEATGESGAKRRDVSRARASSRVEAAAATSVTAEPTPPAPVAAAPSPPAAPPIEDLPIEDGGFELEQGLIIASRPRLEAPLGVTARSEPAEAPTKITTLRDPRAEANAGREGFEPETLASMKGAPTFLEPPTLEPNDGIDIDVVDPMTLEPEIIEFDPIDPPTMSATEQPPRAAQTPLPTPAARSPSRAQGAPPSRSSLETARTLPEIPRDVRRVSPETADVRPTVETRRLSSEKTDPPKMRPPAPDFEALDAAIAEAAEREGGPMEYPARRHSSDPGASNSAPFPLTEDLDIHPERRTKRLALDPDLDDLAREPRRAEKKPPPGASHSPAPPGASQSPSSGRVPALPPSLREGDNELPTWRGPVAEGSIDDDLPTQMVRFSPPPRESAAPTASPPPGAKSIDAQRAAPKSSDTLIDFSLPASLRKEIGERQRKSREASQPQEPPPTGQAANTPAAQDQGRGPSNPRTANFRPSAREEERTPLTATGVKDRSTSESQAKLEESFKREAQRMPSRPRGEAADATLVNTDRKLVAQKIAERARSSLLHAHEGRPSSPKPEDPASKPKPPAAAEAAKKPSTTSTPPQGVPAGEDPRRPSIVVVERSLDEVILSYLHDDMAEE